MYIKNLVKYMLRRHSFVDSNTVWEKIDIRMQWHSSTANVNKKPHHCSSCPYYWTFGFPRYRYESVKLCCLCVISWSWDMKQQWKTIRTPQLRWKLCPSRSLYHHPNCPLETSHCSWITQRLRIEHQHLQASVNPFETSADMKPW